MITRKSLNVFLPVALFAAAIAAWVQMQKAIAANIVTGLGNLLRQLFFQPPLPTHSHMVELWLWISVGWFACGVVSVWRLLRKAKHEQRA
jgi:hypothetical protein